MSDNLSTTVLHSPTAVVAVGPHADFAEWLAAQRIPVSPTNTTHWLPEFITVEENAASIKIEQIRNLKAELALSLHANEGRDVVFLGAEKIFHVAQQALLKILEEPPKRVKFWLVTEQPAALLDTILSRSLVFELPKKEKSNLTPALEDSSILWEKTPGKALRAVQSFSSTLEGREKAIHWVHAVLLQLRANESSTSLQAVAQQQACLEALDWLAANAHVGLTLENLVITLWKTAQKPSK